LDQNQGNFFDRKTIFAVVLTGLVFFGWQRYLNSKYPALDNPVVKTETEALKTPSAEANSAIPKVVAEVKPAPVTGLGETSTKESLIPIQTANYSFDISSYGLGIRNLVLNSYTNRQKEKIKIGTVDSTGLFEFRYNGERVNFNITKNEVSTDGTAVIEGQAKIGEMVIVRTLNFKKGYSVESQLSFKNVATNEFKKFQVYVPEKTIEGVSGSMFSPALEFQEAVVKNVDKVDRVNLSSQKEDLTKPFGIQESFGVTSHYFAAVFSNRSDISPETTVIYKHSSSEVIAVGEYAVSSPKTELTFDGVGYFGPKDFKLLEAIGAGKDFSYIVNFGFFGEIGKILLKVLQFFHEYTIPNWGVAIILLTLLVRLLVLPFNIASFKSMKKMQKIQPKIAALREKYASDPTRLNSEMMTMMKSEKVNPLGGCLPMLLQMPVFFALYQVLGQSIELYQAPFFGWIHDLSLKDPLFVTPVLMGVAMWYNQKITPNTMDPAQAKVMQFLPLVFSFMMIALPSGLTLYIFVSTVFGIVQQQLFLRDKAIPVKS
jgi:YidC/Oxa1 family membrane protein insertase